MRTFDLEDSKRPAFCLYGAAFFPLTEFVIFLLGSFHLTTMAELPIIETATPLSIILSLGFSILALVRRERPVWLSLSNTGIYLFLLAHFVL
jgi:hypothetical protein